MANSVKLKRSAVAGRIPTTADIELGQLAINTFDGKIFLKKDDGTESIVEIGGGGGTGDVIGPNSSTDNALARFDGTTGKLIQNSSSSLDDSGNLGVTSVTTDHVQIDTTGASTQAVGKVQWDDGNGTLEFGLKGGNVNLQIGQEIVARVYNDSGVALTDGHVVYISGSQGNRIAVKLAKADSETTSAGTLGIVTEPIAIGAEGFITMTGTVNKLNTTGLTAGALIYLSASTAGAYTTTPPTAPNHRVTLGYVERVHDTVGSVYVKVDNGYELDELHNVSIVSAANGNLLIYDAVAGVWENANLTAGTGISVTNSAGGVTIANTGVTSVNGVTGSVSAANLLDAIKTVDGAGSGLDADTLDGNSSAYFQQALVSGTNIKTVNSNSLLGAGNIAVGTVTSVGLSVPTGLSVSGSPITGSGTLAVTLSAGYSIPTTASQGNWDSAYSERRQWDGGATNLVASTGRTSLGASTLGSNLFTITNPSAVTFPRFNADNTVSALDAATFRTAIGAGTGNGTVTSVSGTGTVAGLTLSGTVTGSGSLSLSGTFSSNISGISDAYRWWNNFGENHGTRTSFDAQGAASTVNFGWRYVQGNTNGPNVNSSSEYYSQFIGLGNDYPYNQYGMQIAYPRNVSSPYIAIRYEEGGSFGAWQKISAGYADTAGSANSLNSSNSYTAVAFNATSDERVKTNWKDLPIDFVERLAEVKHGIYDRTDIVATQVGASAQSLQGLSPESVIETEGRLAINYGNIALVSAIKLAQEVVALRKEIEELKSK